MTYEDFIRRKLQPLSWPQRIHVINRAYEFLRKIHNGIGSVYKRERTFQDLAQVPAVQRFKDKFPVKYSQLRDALMPYAVDDYLSEEGWNYFVTGIFNPRHDVICHARAVLRHRIKTFSEDQLNALDEAKVIWYSPHEADGHRWMANKRYLRDTPHVDEFEPLEE